jgi:hypothetical protein
VIFDVEKESDCCIGAGIYGVKQKKLLVNSNL